MTNPDDRTIGKSGIVLAILRPLGNYLIFSHSCVTRDANSPRQNLLNYWQHPQTKSIQKQPEHIQSKLNLQNSVILQKIDILV